MRRCVDRFDTFSISLTVHDLHCLDDLKERKLSVAISADRASEHTTVQKSGIWQEDLHLTVEQGIVKIAIDVLDAQGKAACSLFLDPVEDVLKPMSVGKKTFKMQQLSRNIRNPMIKLSYYVDGYNDADIETAGGKEVQAVARLNKNMGGLSPQLRAELLQKAGEDESSKPGGATNQPGSQAPDQRSKLQSELDVLVKAASGPLNKPSEIFGRLHEVYVDVVGPPQFPRYFFRIFKNEKDRNSGKAPEAEIDILRILGLSPDPVREGYFAMKYADKDENIIVVFFERIDRARDVWIEQLDLLVKKVRDLQAKRHKHKRPNVEDVGSSPQGKDKPKEKGGIVRRLNPWGKK